MMLKNDKFVIGSFTVIILAMLALVYFGKATWIEFGAGLGLLSAPSIFGRKEDTK